MHAVEALNGPCPPLLLPLGHALTKITKVTKCDVAIVMFARCMRPRPTCTCNHVLSMQSSPTDMLSIPPPLVPMPHTWIELHLPEVEQNTMLRHRLSSVLAKTKR